MSGCPLSHSDDLSSRMLATMALPPQVGAPICGPNERGWMKTSEIRRVREGNPSAAHPSCSSRAMCARSSRPCKVHKCSFPSHLSWMNETTGAG